MNDAADGTRRVVRALYVDCTHVHQTRNTSGIARVVRNLAILGSEMSGELGLPVRPILQTSQGFAAIPTSWLMPRTRGFVGSLARSIKLASRAAFLSVEDLIARVPALWLACRTGVRTWIASAARRILRGASSVLPSKIRLLVKQSSNWFGDRLTKPASGSLPTRMFFGLVRILLAVAALFTHLIWAVIALIGAALIGAARGISRGLRVAVGVVRSSRTGASRALLAFRLRGRHVQLGQGDVLLLADSNWDSDTLWTRVAEARSRGTIVGSVVYDLIPLRRPDFVDEKLTRVFTRHLHRVGEHNDFTVAISRDSCREFLRFAESARHTGWDETRARTFRLGGDKWTQVHSMCSEAGAEVVRRIGDRPAYLVVGTFEIRKNHRVILDAFDRLWSDGTDVCLLILGRPGYRVDDQMARVRAHPEFGRRLFWAENASDGDLESWYSASRGVIMASYAEGFGLPVAEALARNKPAIVSDIPAHREIADGFCEFFDPADADRLAALLRLDMAGIRNPALRPIASFVWPDWKASVRECLRECVGAAMLGPRAGGSPAIHLGAS